MSTLELTPEQRVDLKHLYLTTSSSLDKDIQAVCDAYAQMIRDSRTHRIVEPPKGYRFSLTANPVIMSISTSPYGDLVTQWLSSLEPLPAPCPPPRLDPVTVTAESVYGELLEAAKRLCEGHESEFGRVADLCAKGFTDGITARSPYAEIWKIDVLDQDSCRICIKTWPA
jgi:hypothetical protein